MAVPGRIRRWLEGLRFPVLLLLTGVVLLANLLIPDARPFVDEMLLALITLLLARLKRKPPESDDPGTGESSDSG
ncbi:MAG: DUF6116 family protein [Pseudomonadota bacterium]